MAMILIVLVFVCASVMPSGYAQSLQATQSEPRVKISLTTFPVDRVTQLSTVQWQVPTGASPVYCISENPAIQLSFACTDCNSTAINESLTKNTQNLTQTAGFPVISLSRLPVNKDMNGKSLICNASYTKSGKRYSVLSKTAKMNILYLERPEIVDENGHKAIENKFYVTDSSDLICNVESNPKPTEYVWIYGSQIAGKTKKLSVDTSRLQQVLRCSTNNGLFQHNTESLAVRVDKWGPPTVVSTNFKTLHQQGTIDQNNKAEIGKTVKLKCAVSGNPKPQVTWIQKSGNGDLKNSSLCKEGTNTQTSETAPTIVGGTWVVASQCSVVISNYSSAGEYWCQVCNSMAQNATHCTPENAKTPSEVATVDVIGSPTQSDVIPSVSKMPNDHLVVIYAHFCADPAPTPPGEIWWQIDNQLINLEKKFDNYLADKPTQNSTHSDCYTARLLVNPMTEHDKLKSYTLKIQNKFGNLNVDVPVAQLFNATSKDNGVSAPKFGSMLFLIVELLVIQLIA